jgi:membrane protease YdiL (CAAX protease family)
MPVESKENNRSETKLKRGGTSASLALAEVLLVFLAFLLWIKYLETTWVGPLQLKLVGWDFFAHLMMVVFPAAALRLFGRPLSELGLSRDQLRLPQIRRLCLAAVIELALIWTVGSLVPHLARGQSPGLLLPPDHFASRIGISPLLANWIGWGLTVVFMVVFCGVGEEVFFRGYMQGRINRAWGRPFRIRGVSFGWGLILASLLFGLGHGVAFFNPFSRPLAFHFEWTSALITCGEGFLFGVLYEFSNGIAAPAAVHAAIGLFFGSIAFSS